MVTTIRHPYCVTGFAIGDRVRHLGDTAAGVVVDDHFHTFDDAHFPARVFVQWEDRSESLLPSEIVIIDENR